MPELKIITQRIQDKNPSVKVFEVDSTVIAEKMIHELVRHSVPETKRGTGIMIFLDKKLEYSNIQT